FLGQLADDIGESLFEEGIEHLIDVQRSRIFIEVDEIEGTSRVLRQVPGIYSFSVVERSPSERKELMKALSSYGKERITEGMTYGLKVKRIGNSNYSSQEIAIEGGGAVISHLPESSVKVNLRDPDIWIEVEIRGPKAYIFTERTRGMGGMPASSQGRVALFLPGMEDGATENDPEVKRALLSSFLMRRRGCKVIPVVEEANGGLWKDVLERSPYGPIGEPFILYAGERIESSLMSALSKLKVDGLVYPYPMERIMDRINLGEMPFVTLYPTVSMADDEVQRWLDVFFIVGNL
ncbi:MAG: THUMP domain-containing protein, partial [Candidatus Thermoplasmatota archaeon]|nr:THUMP domain-containing protein [Candidatus Thermoplasmatota archaeon]